MQCDNEEFIDPGDHLPYQLGVKKDRQNMKTYQRQTAAEKRKRERWERRRTIIPKFPTSGPVFAEMKE